MADCAGAVQSLYPGVQSQRPARRPGFFKGTYNTPGVSHVGIYVGNGRMLHCGDPISYTSINTNYWQNHLYRFGRLP